MRTRCAGLSVSRPAEMLPPMLLENLESFGNPRVSTSRSPGPGRDFSAGTRVGLISLFGVALLLTACSDGSEASPAPSTSAAAETANFPGAEWETTDASAAGLDPEIIDQVAEVAVDSDSNCLLVVRDGKIVDERYWNGTDQDSVQEVFSASKSFTSTLVGIAADNDALEITDPASDYIEQWQDTPSETVTIENLLSNDSGREQTIQTDYIQMAAVAKDKTGYSINLGQDAEPGTEWVYNNAAIQTLEEVMEASTGEDLADFAEARLFGPTGMSKSSIIRDQAGNPLTFMGVQSTCRDMARYGVLALNQGNWDGTQIVSEDWMEQATGQPSQDLNAAYGWLWWLNRPGPTVDPSQFDNEGNPIPQEGPRVPEAPEDMYWASGLGGQYIVVDPGSGVIVVRLGGSDPKPEIPFKAKHASLVVTDGLVDSED